MKKIIIHVGLPKTGSSAIQKYLPDNCAILEPFGHAYVAPPIEDPFEFTSGNAEPLFECVTQRNTNATEQFLSQHVLLNKTSILSSEVLSHFTSSDWAWFQSVLKANNIHIEKIIFFIRNVLPFLLSAYDQAIKLHGEFSEFSDWVRSAEWQQYYACKALIAVFERSLLEPVHYDSLKESIESYFMKSLGIPVGESSEDASVTGARANRSLTKLERYYLLKTNNQLGRFYGEKLAKYFLSKDPFAAAEWPEIAPEELSSIDSRFRQEVVWINQTFFESNSIVSCVGGARFDQTNCGASSGSTRTQGLFSDFLLESLQGHQSQAVKDVCAHLISVGRKSTNRAAVPSDFDPLYYLMLNQDVLVAGLDPAQHYLDHGKTEGRPYRIAI